MADQFVLNSLIHMYASCGDIMAAKVLFDTVEEKDVVTCNAMIAGYFKNGDWKEVVEMFKGMLELQAPFDEVTLVSVATSCGKVGDPKLSGRIGVYAEEKAMVRNRNLANGGRSHGNYWDGDGDGESREPDLEFKWA
ncbi:hypothetical protein ZWY2020_055990 [Hordeum vulgare]|nr:hypothetical protein ZWY2020_055990 [Hordeum vulgare]